VCNVVLHIKYNFSMSLLGVFQLILYVNLPRECFTRTARSSQDFTSCLYDNLDDF